MLLWMTTKEEIRRELLVWGYVRNIEKNHESLIIPLEINNVIYLFARSYDQWSKKYSHKDFTIDSDSAVLKFKGGSIQTAFGKHVVEQGVYNWKLKIISTLGIMHLLRKNFFLDFRSSPPSPS